MEETSVFSNNTEIPDIPYFGTFDHSCNVSLANGSCNNLTSDYGSDDYFSTGTHSPTPLFQALIYVMYSCIFVLALVGNGLVVGVVFSTHRKWTVTNYFILNLALSDILMAVVCIPFSFVTTLILQYWPFGEVMCRLVSYSQAVSVFVSSYTMVVISADRYVAIIYPLRPRMTRRQAKVIMLICWVLALVVALPIIVTSSLNIPSPAYEARELYICIEHWSDATLKHNYNMALLVAQYVLPLSVLLFSYGRIAFELWGKRVPGEANVKRDRRMAESKRKIVKMMMTVVVVFAFCWLPLNVFLVVLDTYRDIDQWPGISYVWFVCHWLAMSHSSYNPFIYCCYHSRFRQGLLSVASRCGCKRCFPVAETFDGMDAEPLQRGNTCTSYASHNSSLRFHRGSTLRPLLSQTSQMGHGSVYGGRNHTASFRTSVRCNSESEAMPVIKSSFKSLDTRRPSDINEAGLLPDPAVLKDEVGTMNNCKLLFRSNLKRRLSQGKVEMQVFSENDSG